MKNTYDTGVRGEREAEAYLAKLGMRCLERRYRTKHAEIDLVMLDGSTIVFVEVKTRTVGEPGCGLVSITSSKQKKITQAATVYLMTHHMLDQNDRFDAVEIINGKITHIPNAFQPGGMFF